MTTNLNRQPSDDAPRVPSDLAVVTPRPMSPLEARLRSDFEDVRAVVDTSQVAVTYEYLCVKRSEKGKVLGRPRKMTMRAFLILAILTCLRDRPPSIVKITETANELPEDLLEELGLMKPGGTRPTITESQIGHVFNLLANSLDVSPHRPGKRLRITDTGEVIDEYKTAQIDRKCLDPDLTDEELTPPSATRRLADRKESELGVDVVESRVAVLHGLIDDLLQATIRSDLDIRTTAVDWTDREAWARGGRHATKARDGVVSADPDAKWGRRRPSGNSFTPSRRSPKKAIGPLDEDGFETDKIEYYFGYLVHVAVATKEVDGPPVPELVLALRVAPADDMAGVGPAVVDMIDSIRSVAPIDHAIVDRGYSMRAAESVHLPLADRNVHLTFDLSQPQRQRHGTTKDGAIMMGGDFYCPMLPRDIEVEGIPGPQATREDWAAYHRRREIREAWMMARKGKPTADMNTQRLVCPAVAGNTRCPLRPDSMALPEDKNIPEIFDDQLDDIREAPPGCCTAKSFTVYQEDGAGRRQQHSFGSPEWIRSYDRRTASERVISHYKKLVRTGREDVQVFGRTRQTLAVGFATVALNIRLLRGWDEKQNDIA